jgi:hypothetical protein
MTSILITGVPKSGTTALYAAYAAKFSRTGFSFLEPSISHQDQLADLARGSRFDLIVKTVLSEDIRPAFLASFDHVVATLRDPRDVVVSWLPFRAVSNPRYYTNDALLSDIKEAFQHKAAKSDSVDVTAIEEIYRQHRVPIFSPTDYAVSYKRLLALRETRPVLIQRFEEFTRSGRSSDSTPDELAFQLRPLTGEISVNQRSGSSGEWKKWFSKRDADRYRPHLAPMIDKFGYEPWTEHAEILDEIDPEHYSIYLEKALNKRKALVSSIQTWTSKYEKSKKSLFGRLKSEEAYRDLAYKAKLRERAENGAVSALQEYAKAVEAGFIEANDFFSSNIGEIRDALRQNPSS